MTNFLLITTDQQRGDCVGYAGRSVKTPHIDLLAREGTRFDLCVTPNVVCQPARASLLTGLLPLTHGVIDNGYDLPREVGERGFGGRLAADGYRTGFIGKAHFATSHTFSPTGSPECRESTASYGPDWFGPYMGFEHVELVVEGHNNWLPMKPPHGQHYERWYYSDGLGEEKNRLYRQRLGSDVGALQTWNSALPVAWHNSTWVGNRSIAFLQEQAKQSQPFLLWASFPDPHHPFDAPAPWCFLHDPAEVDLPPYRSLDFGRRPWWHAQAFDGQPDPRVAEIRGNFNEARPQTDEQLRSLIANYYGMISLVDHNVGRILTELNDLGLNEDTVVIFTSDHGEWLGDHGLMFKGPMLYEGLVRVPLVVRGPGVGKDAIVEDPVSTLDIAATLCDLGGADSSGLHGNSLRHFLDGTGGSRRYAYNEWNLDKSRCGVEVQLRLVRTKRYKLCKDLISGDGELYDMEADPYECENRFEDPAFASIRAELEAMITERVTDFCEPTLARVGMA